MLDALTALLRASPLYWSGSDGGATDVRSRVAGSARHLVFGQTQPSILNTGEVVLFKYQVPDNMDFVVYDVSFQSCYDGTWGLPPQFAGDDTNSIANGQGACWVICNDNGSVRFQLGTGAGANQQTWGFDSIDVRGVGSSYWVVNGQFLQAYNSCWLFSSNVDHFYVFQGGQTVELRCNRSNWINFAASSPPGATQNYRISSFLVTKGLLSQLYSSAALASQFAVDHGGNEYMPAAPGNSILSVPGGDSVVCNDNGSITITINGLPVTIQGSGGGVALTMDGQLVVSTGGADITGNVLIAGNLHVTGTSNLDGAVTCGGGVTISAGGLNVTGNTVVGNLQINGNLVILGSFTYIATVSGGDDINAATILHSTTVSRFNYLSGSTGVNAHAYFQWPPLSENPTTISTPNANQVLVWQFYLPMKITLNHFLFLVTSHISGNGEVGLYDADGNITTCRSGVFAGTGVQNIAVTVTLSPGFYFIAVTNSTAGALALEGTSISIGSGTGNILNQAGTQVASAANASVAGALPNTLGALTRRSTTAQMVAPYFVITVD